jgi:hypothetical protein
MGLLSAINPRNLVKFFLYFFVRRPFLATLAVGNRDTLTDYRLLTKKAVGSR